MRHTVVFPRTRGSDTAGATQHSESGDLDFGRPFEPRSDLPWLTHVAADRHHPWAFHHDHRRSRCAVWLGGVALDFDARGVASNDEDDASWDVGNAAVARGLHA